MAEVKGQGLASHKKADELSISADKSSQGDLA